MSLLPESRLNNAKNAFQAKLQAYAQKMLGSRTEAEDVVAETFLRLWDGLATKTLRGKSEIELRTWLFRVTRNLCIDILRKKRVCICYDYIEDGTTADIRRAEGEMYVEGMLNGLFNMNEMLIITLRVEEQLGIEEMAERLGISPSAAKSRWYRVRNRLRKVLKPVGAPLYTHAAASATRH